MAKAEIFVRYELIANENFSFELGINVRDWFKLAKNDRTKKRHYRNFVFYIILKTLASRVKFKLKTVHVVKENYSERQKILTAAKTGVSPVKKKTAETDRIEIPT